MTAGGGRSRAGRSAFGRGFASIMTAIGTVFAAPIACSASTPIEAVLPIPCRGFIADAAKRFGVSEKRLSAIMRLESGGSMHAISRAGAMGCMQIMPATWDHLRTENALGNDPFDPHDNVIAGAAYLRELIDLYGWPGALAAYNAGPNRYAEFLSGGRALPSETRKYVARIATVLPANDAQPDLSAAMVVRPRWTEAPIFVAARVDRALQRSMPSVEGSTSRSQVTEQAKPADTIDPQSSGNLLFVGQHR